MNKNLYRGFLVVFEGIDRCGKTTQAKLLVDALKADGIECEYMCFPTRSSVIGGVIGQFLRREIELDDYAAHLIFAADRRSCYDIIEHKLKSGITVVLDRYMYSGIAYSSARGIDLDWCMNVEVGLRRADVIFFINKNEMAERSGVSERYEESSFQMEVYKCFINLFKRREVKRLVSNVDAQSLESLHSFVYNKFLEKYCMQALDGEVD
jgi:dTMP kinase